MTDDEFWSLIERARPLDDDNGCEPLIALLGDLPTDQIAAFSRTFEHLYAAADRWDVWAAAYIIRGGCSDDGFDYFRGWLIAQGREVFETALRDPDALAGFEVVRDAFEDDYADCESILSVADDAYEARTGEQLPLPEEERPETAGEYWDFEDSDEMRRRLPGLSALG